MIQNFLVNLIATFTGPRYLPEFEWSKNLWTHNVFRFFGMVFGEKYGVYPSVSSWQDKDGNHQVGYTLEAQLAIFEGAVRAWLSQKIAFKVVLIPKLQLVGMGTMGLQPYRFAIALDFASGNQTNAAAGSNPALAHTCTGSNLVLNVAEVGDINATNTITGITYNSLAMTNVDAQRIPSDRWIVSYIQTGPSTGTNNIASSGNTFGGKNGVSYTGCSQTGQPDSHAISLTSVAVTITWSTTVVASSCWLWGAVYGDLTVPTATPGTGTVFRGTTAGSGAGAVDSNGTVGTGSQSLQVNQNSSNAAMVPIMSIKPPGAVVVKSGFFFKMVS